MNHNFYHAQFTTRRLYHGNLALTPPLCNESAPNRHSKIRKNVVVVCALEPAEIREKSILFAGEVGLTAHLWGWGIGVVLTFSWGDGRMVLSEEL